jgi:CHAT domain-containing protein/tetratricopeptide (TPR) repeat protein
LYLLSLLRRNTAALKLKRPFDREDLSMLLRFNASTLSSNTPRLLLHRSLLLLLTLSLLASTLAAQSDKSTKWAEAEKLSSEGKRLSAEASRGPKAQASQKFEQALQKFEQARELFHSIKEFGWEAHTLEDIGQVYRSMGNQQKALAYLARALPLFHAAKELFNEGYTHIRIGDIYDDLGEKQKALAHYMLAAPLFRPDFLYEGEASAYKRIGRVYDDLGDKQEALANFEKALSLSQGDRDNEAVILSQIGKIYDEIGEKQKALDSLGKAWSLCRAINKRQGEAAILTSLGKIYLDLGQEEKALGSLEQALLIFQEIKDHQGEAYTLVGLGRVQDVMDLPRKALENYLKALPIFQDIKDRRGEAYTINNIGKVYFDLGEKQKTLENYLKALSIFQEIKDRPGEALALSNIGALYRQLGEKQKALDYVTQALRLNRAISDRSGEAQTLRGLAISEYEQGKLSEARANSEASIAIIESLRTKITNQDLRSSYFATVQGYYKFYIEVLMSLHKQRPTGGYDGEALQASERARARVLLETLAEANANIRQGVDPALVERERSLQKRLDATAKNQQTLLSNPYTKEQANAIAKEIEALTTELQQVDTQIRQTSPRYAALTQPQPLTLKEIQTQILDADTLLLEYSLGVERSYVWAVTPDSITSYELPKYDEIEAAARLVYSRLTARNRRIDGETKEQWSARIARLDRELPAVTAALSRMLLTPVATQLGKKRLVIVADGMLQYIPFAVLPSPQAQGLGNSETNQSPSLDPQPLIVEHEIVSLPSASTLSVIRREVAGRKPAPKTVVALADPVFTKNDERVKKGSLAKTNDNAKDAESVKELELVEAAEDTGVSSEGLYVPRLPGSRKEAEEIVAMVPASERRLALDFEASREVATSPELSQYRYVHFSTHGFLNSVRPELSGIVFSLVDERGEAQDGFLRAHEVFNLKLPAEVVVLSACQTGIGREVRGEGLVSLTRGFMYAGAPRVVVSLWSVSELGTAELMVRFYQEMLKGGKRPAEALRAAQVSLMKEKRWQSPFYWAPFTLQGEWR